MDADELQSGDEALTKLKGNAKKAAVYELWSREGFTIAIRPWAGRLKKADLGKLAKLLVEAASGMSARWSPEVRAELVFALKDAPCKRASPS